MDDRVKLETVRFSIFLFVSFITAILHALTLFVHRQELEVRIVTSRDGADQILSGVEESSLTSRKSLAKLAAIHAQGQTAATKHFFYNKLKC